MKDTSRPHTSPSRSTPYRKRKASGLISPSRSTRRAHDASQSYMITSDMEHNPRRHEAHSRAIPSANDEHRSLSKTGGMHNDVAYARKDTSTGESARDRPSRTSALGTQADVPGPSLRLPVTPGLPTTHACASQWRAESTPPGSVTAFLRSIELPDKPPSTPPPQEPTSSNPLLLRLPSLSTDNVNKDTCTNGSDHQVSFVYRGYPFTYDLAALPDDPNGTIALLSITKSDPGAYLLVGAHYRRTGRSRAACAVIRSLLDHLDGSPHTEKEKGDAAPNPASDTSTPTLPSLDIPCSKLADRPMSVFKRAAMRPAMLLLAACELDISRECPDDPESDTHAAKAHELFHAIYGVASDAVIAGPAYVKPTDKNALGLDFSSNRRCTPTVPEMVPMMRVKDLEEELSTVRAAHKMLQEKLEMSNDRLTSAEDEVRALESRAREMLIQLDASRDENWELHQQLAESQQRATDLVQCTPTVESRVWGRLKDLLFDNLGASMRGE